MFPAITYFLGEKYVKTTKKSNKFHFYFLPSSDMSLQAYFIYLFIFFTTSQEYPCRDPSTKEYYVCALKFCTDNQSTHKQAKLRMYGTVSIF